MNKSCRVSSTPLAAAFCAVALLAVALFSPVTARAQNAGTGTITGRVLNEGTGDYLRNAVVAVDGTALSAVSEAGGVYSLSGVPAGEAHLTITYTGLDTVKVAVPVFAGQTAKHDFNLTSKDYLNNEILKLGQFVVTTEREGQAKAIMEQREAVNMKSVMASDAFGDVSEGNLGEFLKLMPGVTIDYNEADAKFVRIRGMDPKYTSVTMDGAPIASGSSSDLSTNRAFDFEQLSVASVETIEMSKTPRASDAGSALAGTVNVRSKGAFDSKGRRISYKSGFSMNSLDRTFGKTPGPKDDMTYKVMPNATFQYSDTFLDNKLGVLAGFNYSYTFSEQKAETVNYAAGDTNSDNNATEVRRVASFSYRDSPKPSTRKNFNVRFDYKFDLSDGATLWSSAKMDYNTYNGKFFSRDLGFNFGTTDLTQPYTYATQTTTATGGSVQPNGGGGATDKHGTTLTFSTTTDFKKGAFRAYFVGQYSKATNYYTDLTEGFFFTMGANTLPAQLRFNRGGPMDPGIYITQLGGADWRNLANYTMAAPASTSRFNKSQQYTGKTDMSYDVTKFSIPVKLNFGVATNESIRNNHRYTSNIAYTLLGADGIRNTADDSPAAYAEPYYRMNFGWGGNVDGMTNVDRFALGRALGANPSWWTFPNFNTGQVQSTLQNSAYFKEQINAAYLEPIIKITKKLQITPGVRYEFSREFGVGPVDLGDVAARRRLFNLPATTPVAQVPAWPAGTSDLSYILARYGSGRRAGGNNYGTFLRYLHATYSATSKVDFRVSYNESITRPDISNLIPGISGINETAVPFPTITVSNPDLKPEYGRNVNFEVDYYFARGSSVSATFFRTDTKNLQRTISEELGPDGFQGDTTYAGYLASTKENVAKSHSAGLEFNFTQQLSVLSERLRGVSVFANFTNLLPDDQANYLGSAKHSASGGVSYRYKRFDAKVNFNWTGVRKTGVAPLAGAASAGWANYQSDVFLTGINLGYNVSRGVSLYANGRNIFNEPNVTYTTAPGAPKLATRFFNSGAVVEFGVKGNF